MLMDRFGALPLSGKLEQRLYLVGRTCWRCMVGVLRIRLLMALRLPPMIRDTGMPPPWNSFYGSPKVFGGLEGCWMFRNPSLLVAFRALWKLSSAPGCAGSSMAVDVSIAVPGDSPGKCADLSRYLLRSSGNRWALVPARSNS